MKILSTSAFLYIAIIGMLSVSFLGCAKNDSKGLTITNGVLSVGVEIGYPPMEYYDTDGVTLLGFDIELTKALAQKLGLEVKYIDTSWEGILPGLDAGRFDIAVNITILPERQKNYNFTKPYINSYITIAALRNTYMKFDKPELISGKRIGYQGDTTAQYFTENIIEQGYKIASFSYDKIINCFNDLKLKRIDLVVVDNIAASHYVNHSLGNERSFKNECSRGNDDTSFEIVWESPVNEHIGICLKKGNDALTLALNNALDELFRDGTIQEISRQIFNADLVTSVLD